MIEEVDDLDGVKVGGINRNCMRFAGGTVHISGTEEKVQELVTALNRPCVERGMKIKNRPGNTEVSD